MYVYTNTYVYVTIINKKGGQEFGKSKEVSLRGLWKEERERRTVIIL